MALNNTSGQDPFVFTLREDLCNLPQSAKNHEVDLHGSFAIDSQQDNHIYYGMPGYGIMRIDPDLSKQQVIKLPDELESVNFHSTVIGEFENKRRLILSANADEMVVILTMDGELDFVLPRPIFDEYKNPDSPYKPTDTTLINDELFIADGYGSNYILSASLTTKEWTGIFGGKTEVATEDGKFATAHGININPTHHQIDIADRPHSRIQVHGKNGNFKASHKLPHGAYLCGISYLKYKSRWYGVIACLQDPDEGRPAPIYIIDAESYELISTIRPKEDLGVELADHLHNVALHVQGDQLYLICQAWNPGHYFVLEKV